jgi:flagellar hook-associated protein 3 FlgL
MRVNPNYTPDILADLWQSQAQEQTAIQQLATGKRVNMPSDDPAAAAADVQNQALQSQNDQYIQNTSNLDGSLQTADSALSSVVTALNQAISLGVQGANGGVSSADQQALALQVQSIQSQLVQLGNTSYQGSFLFGGTATQSAPFALDSTQPSGVLYSGNTTNIGTATTQVGSALSYVSEQRVFYGSAVSQLNSNQSFLQQEQVSLQTQDTSLVGVDFAKAATDLSQAQAAQSATLAALAQIIPQSLLNYLK